MSLFSIPALLLFIFFACSFAYLSWQANIDILEKEVIFKVENQEDIMATRINQSDIHIRWNASVSPSHIALTTVRFPQKTTVYAVPGGENSIKLTDIPPSPRPYFRLEQEKQKSITIAERILPFEKVNNFRDLGGYQTSGCQTLKWGRIYRSGHLGSPSRFDLDVLQDLGIRTVIDLRGAEERKKTPDTLLPGVNYLHIPLFRSDPFLFRHIMFQRHKLGKRLETIYTTWVIDGSAKEMGRIFRLISDPGNLPVLFHCTAGKDRTGITAALLLLALGVPESTAIADYTLSNAAADRFMIDFQQSISAVRFLGIKQEHFYPIIATPPEMMASTIDHIKHKYGSIRNYLRKTAGVSDDMLDQLKAILLES